MPVNTTGISSQQAFTPGSPPATFAIPNTITYQKASEIYATLSQAGLADQPLTQGVDFSVSAGPSVGGTLTVLGVNWAGLYAAYGTITIYRQTAKIQTDNIVNGGAIDGPTLTQVLDEIVQMEQEGAASTSKAIVGPVTDPPGLSYQLPAAGTRALQSFMFDAQGQPLAGLPSGAPINAAWQAALAQATTAALLSAFGINSAWQAGLASGTPPVLVAALGLIYPAAAYVAISAGSPYTVLSTTDLLDVTTGGSNFLVNLPVAASSLGRRLDIRKADSGSGKVQITPNGADVINGITGAASWEITEQYGHCLLEAVTGGWRVLNSDGTIYRNVLTTLQTQAGAAQNTWYNIGGSLTLAPGVYEVSYQASPGCNAVDPINSTLSTGAASETDADMSAAVAIAVANGALPVYRSKRYVVAATTTFYLNLRVTALGSPTISFQAGGGSGSTRIEAKRVA